MNRKGFEWIGKLGHRMADYDPQNGPIVSRLIRLFWRIGYKKVHNES